jgi:hemolysin III
MPIKTSRQGWWDVGREPVSWASHFAGMLAAVVGLVVLLDRTPPEPTKQGTMAIYGASVVLLFGASATYHFFDIGPRGNRWLRRFDHCAIFLLIAGSFLPAVVHLLDGPWRTGTLLALGSATALGIGFKLFWIDAPRWLGTAVYAAIGWGAVVPVFKMYGQLDATALAWLFGGGLAYSVGAVVYVIDKPHPVPGVVGAHEVWHGFVLAGAACHYFFALGFCEVACPPFV